MSALTDQLTASIAALSSFSDSVASDVEALKAAHAGVLAKGEALVQKIQSSSTPVPAAITTAAAALAAGHPALSAYAARIDGVNEAFSQVVGAIQSAISPTAVVVSAEPPPLPHG